MPRKTIPVYFCLNIQTYSCFFFFHEFKYFSSHYLFFFLDLSFQLLGAIEFFRNSAIEVIFIVINY